MATCVQQHVAERAVAFASRPQDADMVAIREHRAAQPRGAIHGPCEARTERHHAATERLAIDRFHDQVRVVALDRVMHEPETRTRTAGPKGALDFVDDRHRAQRRKTRPHA